MRSSPWAIYRPTAAQPWNWARAWTLRRRAGFGATWAELERDVADGPERAVDRVLAGACRLDGVPADFAATADFLGTSAASASDPRRLQAWWLYRMLATPDPLAERVTLMWHDHFATSQAKVDDVAAMHRQNDTSAASGPVRSATSSAPCSATRRSWSGSTPRATAKGESTKTSAASSWNCSPWASATTPRPTSRPPPAP